MGQLYFAGLWNSENRVHRLVWLALVILFVALVLAGAVLVGQLNLGPGFD